MKRNNFIAVILIFALSACVQKTATEHAPAGDSVTVAITDTVHTTRNSVDWQGEYAGTLPCADCEGIEILIAINADGTYSSTSTYLGKESAFEDKGTFTWDETGSKITLKSNEGEQMYLVGEGTLTMLNSEGKVTEGELADDYVLKKK